VDYYSDIENPLSTSAAIQFHTHPFNYGISRGEILTQPGLKSMAKALSEGQIN